MLAKRHELARMYGDFYRDQFRRTLRWLLVAVSIMIILLFGIAYAILIQPPQQYYANTTDGAILVMQAADSQKK